MSKKRILKELQKVQQSKPHGIIVTIPTDNLFIWEAEFVAPRQSLYRGANLKIQIVLPENYPLSPPKVRFLTPLYHVNINQTTGHVCFGFINDQNWIPTNEIEDILRAVYSLIIKPQLDTVEDQNMLTEYNNSISIYQRKAKQSALKYK